MYCLTNDAPTFTVARDGVAICFRCRADLGTEHGRLTHPDHKPLRSDYVAKTTSQQYVANLLAIQAVQRLWKYDIHGDDAKGWMDLEFKDLVTAASFIQVLPGGVAENATFRSGITHFKGQTVVITFPVPDDRSLF